MKKEKQEIILSILQAGKYRVKEDKVFSFDKALVASVLGSGHSQYKLYTGIGKNKPVLVYKHYALWLNAYGLVADDKKVGFKDGNVKNCVLSNLVLLDRHLDDNRSDKIRTIRFDEIQNIKFCLRGGMKNHSAIARKLSLNRLSVRRTIKKIEAGEELFFDSEKRRLNPRDKVGNALANKNECL